MPKLKVQFHIHSKQDPRDNIKYSEKQIIDRASRLGYDSIAITCHDVIIFNEDLKKYAEKKRILLIPGIEKTIQKKHVVILNADLAAQSINSFEDLKKYKDNHPESLIIAAHPYYPGSVSLKKEFDKHHKLFDAVEYSWFHSKRFNKCNEKAAAASEKYDLPILGTSDNHNLKYIDQTYSILEADGKNIKSILKAVRKNKIEVISHNICIFKLFWIYLEMTVRFYIKRILLQ
jgi:predicted metal-dependent phosphoesterase TrpH